MTNPQLPITTQSIRKLVESSVYQRGKEYFQAGAIKSINQQGYSLSGTCVGSRRNVYKIHVHFNDKAVIEAICTCPYDWGVCKHVVALLLTYLEKPQSVEQQPSIAALLENMSREQLIYFIEKIVQKYPETYKLLGQPVPAESGVLSADIIKKLQQELQESLHGNNYEFSYDRYDDDYGDYGQTQERIEAVLDKVNLAKQFAAKNNWTATRQIIEAMIDPMISAGYEYDLFDETEAFFEPIDEIVAVLAGGLAAPIVRDHDTERAHFFDTLITLLDLYIDVSWDTKNIEDAIAGNAQIADLPHLRGRIKNVSAETDHGWGLEIYARMLSQLDLLDNTDPETTLQRLREAGFFHLVQEKLLDLKRVDEAVALAQAKHLNNKDDLLRAILIFEQKDYLEQAVQLAESYIANQFDEWVVATLKRLYHAQGNTKGSLHIALQSFKRTPSIQTYNEIKNLAAATEEWEGIHASLVQQLTERSEFQLLVRIYLHDEEFDTAIELFREIPRPAVPHFRWTAFEWEVAQAVRFEYPTIALPFYLEKVHQMISVRNRSAYIDAVKLLREVRQIYESDDEIIAFHKLLNDLKEQYKTLRAFHDELKKAGF